MSPHPNPLIVKSCMVEQLRWMGSNSELYVEVLNKAGLFGKVRGNFRLQPRTSTQKHMFSNLLIFMYKFYFGLCFLFDIYFDRIALAVTYIRIL